MLPPTFPPSSGTFGQMAPNPLAGMFQPLPAAPPANPMLVNQQVTDRHAHVQPHASTILIPAILQYICSRQLLSTVMACCLLWCSMRSDYLMPSEFLCFSCFQVQTLQARIGPKRGKMFSTCQVFVPCMSASLLLLSSSDAAQKLPLLCFCAFKSNSKKQPCRKTSSWDILANTEYADAPLLSPSMFIISQHIGPLTASCTALCSVLGLPHCPIIIISDGMTRPGVFLLDSRIPKLT